MPTTDPHGRIDVREVNGPRERKRFLRLPFDIYGPDSLWVPPLLSSLDKQLDPRRHPFYQHADIRLYLAWRSGKPVGRIAVIVNHLHNSHHDDKLGFWGFFEAQDDAGAVQALLDRAAADLRERGMTEMAGPFNPSINAECGLLVDGFDRPPAILMPYNPPYYPRLVEHAGHEPVKELYAYELAIEQIAPDKANRQRLDRIAAAVRKRHAELTVRPLNMKHYEDDVIALGEVFNAARRDNWGFVPTTDAELKLMAREMKLIVQPELVLVAEIDNRPVGCLMALPEINPLLKKLNGRLLPFGWARLLWGKGKVNRLRTFGAASLPEFRNIGVIPLLFAEFIARGTRLGYTTSELSWVAEDNLASMRTLEAAFHPELSKRYRIYGRDL